MDADECHHDHALVEQVIAELKDNALAHLQSGKYTANPAWVALAVTAFNLARATAVAASMRRSRWASVRKKIIDIPGRIASIARRLDQHLSTDWSWATGWESLFLGPRRRRLGGQVVTARVGR